MGRNIEEVLKSMDYKSQQGLKLGGSEHERELEKEEQCLKSIMLKIMEECNHW